MQLRQSRPRDGREVMVLVVQAHVVRQQVQRAVIRERFWHRGVGERVPGGGTLLLEDIVLSNEVARAGVQGAGEKGGEDQVVERVGSGELDESVVEGDLCYNVDEMDAGEWHFKDEDWADGVEYDLEGAEECLPEDGVKKEGFGGGRKVSIKPVNTEGLVVGKVIWLFQISLILPLNITFN